VLIITSRLNHIDKLYELLVERGVDVGKICGTLREMKNQVIIGIIKIVQEGLDIPELNTLVIATPEGSNILKQTQIVGRILRQKQEIPPLYIDIFDYPMAYKNQKRYDGYNKIFSNIHTNLIECVRIEKDIRMTEKMDEVQFREIFMKNM
jgi:superfamily II DNA or RNA helicase